MKFSPLHILFASAASLVATFARAEAPPPDYAKVHAIFAKHCLSCHDTKEAEGDLILESHATLMKGGETGPAVVAGKSGESLLVKLIEHAKKPYMPPPKKGDKLSDADIATIRSWIDAGAVAPSSEGVAAPAAALPHVAPVKQTAAPVRAVTTDGTRLAVARGDTVEIIDETYRDVSATFAVDAGPVNALVFSADGTRLAAAAGAPGVGGVVKLWDMNEAKLIATFKGHADAIYTVALSPDGSMLATGSYDQKIILWDVKSAQPIRTLSGHNGAVFGLSFRPDGKVLASASGDRTVKLWNVATGDRLDTLSDATKELYCVTFSRDGKRVAAGGVDNRVRVWAISDTAMEGTNKIVHSTFAHEGAILSLALSTDGKTLITTADDRTAKIWNFNDMSPRFALPQQSDWPAGAAFARGDKAIVIGRLDGSFGFYNAADGKDLPPSRPMIASPKRFGVQRGQAVRLELHGEGLHALGAVSVSEARATAKLLTDPASTRNQAWVEISTPSDLPPSAMELRVTGAGGASDPITLHLDTVPQQVETEPNDSPTSVTTLGALPTSVWGKMDRRGDVDRFAFDAKAGRTIVFDVAAKRFGSAADVVLTLLDPDGRAVAGVNDFADDVDPLLAYTVPADGRYTVCVSELSAAASENHFYRLSIGQFAYVTGVYPLAVAPGATTPVRLLGFNLPKDASVNVNAPAGGEAAVPIDANVYRSRRSLKVLAGFDNESTEREPNDVPDQSTTLPVPGGVSGIIGVTKSDGSPDVDCYRIEAKAGQTWVVETMAARLGTPTDTKIEILDAAGKPVPRVALRAVRDSAITFRPITADAGGARLVHWEEMDLNQYLYLNGEVVKLFQAPRGPDSEFGFHTLGGRRIDYFDTSAAAHALDEACYIVEPHAPAEAAKLPPNGLPTFIIPYANDDDAKRQLGADSRLNFSPPTSGTYFIRVTDTRGFGGDRYAYRLVVRPAKPDFSVSIDNPTPTVAPGAGRRFTARVDRIDGFDGPVRVEFNHAPAGFTVSSPLLIEAGLTEAQGTVYASADAKEPTEEALSAMHGSATAVIDGKEVVKSIESFKKIALGPKPGLTVALAPDPKAALAQSAAATARGEKANQDEIVLTPGKLTPAWLRITRGSHADRVTFEVENLPHGVIVADIGLNGVLIPEGQSERQIFLQCAPWVPDSDRLCHARANEADQPTSPPTWVRVRHAK